MNSVTAEAVQSAGDVGKHWYHLHRNRAAVCTAQKPCEDDISHTFCRKVTLYPFVVESEVCGSKAAIALNAQVYVLAARPRVSA